MITCSIKPEGESFAIKFMGYSPKAHKNSNTFNARIKIKRLPSLRELNRH